MDKKMKSIGKPVLFLIALLALMLAIGGCSPQAPASEVPASETPNAESPGSEAQAEDPYNKVIPFELPDLDGNIVSISDFEEKYVLINFWATWCTYCDQEMPDLQKLQDNYGDELVVILVNVQEKEEEVGAYLEKRGLSMLTVLDQKGEVSGMYGVTGMPSSYFVTPDQRVIGYVAGMMSYETMEQSLEYVKEQYEATK
ncbi:TlpA family protein disulfide reductase [Acidaminobacter hydrogenoformans]|uniref:Thiol-disulfide isomerase or thioredoxin n=1 Tax=Acidaminobacter hydrogenoformans DSM 2784 TaxID=1120920 RepID=A0A1G5S5T8_9FIRM|nr:TlpA disulfide reductase family protein [Acidaminobacter hydrogenoformans]SCZ81704.1 Thiol-disulfide isomerase or thioredoxin [Acidaminobacter hydrogenoformans DSM 2784]